MKSQTTRQAASNALIGLVNEAENRQDGDPMQYSADTFQCFKALALSLIGKAQVNAGDLMYLIRFDDKLKRDIALRAHAYQQKISDANNGHATTAQKLIAFHERAKEGGAGQDYNFG